MASKKKEGLSSVSEKPRNASANRNVAQQQSAEEAQIAHLERGLRLFREQRFAEAKDGFEQAAQGPQRNVMHAARNHLAVCERRLAKPSVSLQTADDHYNCGIERLNARDLQNAHEHLRLAVSMNPQCDYMLYALAAADALTGDAASSYENLRRAIQGDPRNRSTARSDPDFAGVVHDPRFATLFNPDRA